MVEGTGEKPETQTAAAEGDGDAAVPGIGAAPIDKKRLAVIENCGHRPELEKRAEFLQLVQRFLSEP